MRGEAYAAYGAVLEDDSADARHRLRAGVSHAMRLPRARTKRRGISGELDSLGLEILAERLEHLLDDALRIEAGASVHRGRAVVVKEHVRQHHRAEAQHAAIEHAV